MCDGVTQVNRVAIISSEAHGDEIGINAGGAVEKLRELVAFVSRTIILDQ